MLISRIPDNDVGKGEEIVSVPIEENDSHEYQTANELFELMAKNQNFDTDVDKLTTRDLVLLYKNIDLGTKLMSNTTELQRKKPNQHVESVVYNDESDSDISERYSSEDLRSVILLNSERLDLLNAPPSAENTLCHKLGDLQMQTSSLTTDYEKHFLFNDPYIKEQLKSLKLMNKSTDIEKAVLPASLLDYVCCKHLEDNYNFYMDNIIRHVKNTIDQLKRISNGDYLTDKAKEKWQEVENTAEDRINTKVLATSTSIPLHVERNISGRKTTWDDLVHSAVDIRSLSKILEKRIVVEVPKLLCGPYKLLSKCCAENFIISCKKDKQPVEERVDVVFQLQRSETGEVISNINSIMILQSAPVECDILEPEVLPLPLTYIEPINDDIPSLETKSKIIELEPITITESVQEVFIKSEGTMHSSENIIEDSLLDSIDFGCSDNDVTDSLRNSSYQESSDAGEALKDILDRKHTISQKEASSDVFRDDLRMTIRKLTLQSVLTEESGEETSLSTSKRKKSLTRVRIKSPYENQSYVMEEKKRRKLLEIRERRERKKMALVENCKITKHKYAKGTTSPQSASSVTKLSISNKSFYDSIYGQATNADPSKQGKGKNRKGGKRDVLEINMNDNNEGDEHDESVLSTPDKNSKKYINRSYYLDDADTEMMYTNMKRNENDAKEFGSTSTSVISNDFGNNLNYLSQLMGPFETDLNIGDDEIFPDKVKLLSTTIIDDVNDARTSIESFTPKNIIKVPLNSPNINDQDNTESKKATSSVECRKSIDKIYTLMNKLGEAQETKNKLTKSKLSKNIDEKEGRFMCLGTESGTSLKHRMTSSNPSSFASFDKNNTEKPNNTHNKKPGSLLPIVPKVVISSKLSLPKTDLENNRKNCKRSGTNLSIKVPENPLKAISQLLHEFENVQKTRRKQGTDTEQKHAKKIEMAPNDGIGESWKNSSKRRSRLDKHNDSQTDRHVRLSTPKEKKSRQNKEMDLPKTPYQQIPVPIPDDKHTDRLPRKKIIEMLDEAKEARGEAVRGPSKLNSRLNSLAQPKRTYVQAHSEEYQTKYGRTLMADRLQRLAAAPPQSLDRPSGSANTRNRLKRSGSEAVPAIRASKSPPSPVPPPERAFRTRHSPNSIPEGKERLNQLMGSSYKQVSIQETPPILKKKMVAVESYVKNHYRRTSPNSQNRSDPQTAQKLRVPLLPNDIDIASSTSSAFQESSELGSRLHNIISSIMKTTTSQGLEVLTECQESTGHTENRSCTGRSSSGSDYTLDVLNDNNVITSVENIEKASEKEQKQTSFKMTGAIQMDLQPDRSLAELDRLENALCSHFSVGTFQKRLQIKNLNMTPKQSMQQVFVLESGDAGSLVVQSPIGTTKKENSECFSELSAMPILSKPHIDWRFGSFPMQISTVGYAFADYKSIQCNSNSLVHLFDKVSKKSEEEKLLFCTNHKGGEDVSKGEELTLHTEQAAQVDFLDSTTLVTVGISSSCTHVIQSDKNRNMERTTINAEPKSAFIDFSQNNEVADTLKGRETKTDTVTENKDKVSEAEKPENIEYTTSLDILVGLLNEIQNITTCQTQITKSDKEKSPSEIQQSKVLETILINEAANAMEHSMKSSRCDVVSFTSLDRLRQLESNPSLYSFYLSDNVGSEKCISKLDFPSEIIPKYSNELWCPKTIYVDKEVGVDLIDRGAVSKFTDAPSKVHTHDMSHNTNMSNSLVRVFNKPSVQAMFFAECPPVESNAVLLEKKSIQNMPQILITRETKQSLEFYDVINETIEKPENKPHKFTIRVQSLEKDRIKNITKVNNGQFSFKTDFDPIMKMKRDILVTVYSILVFTVFAALSFPEILYRI